MDENHLCIVGLVYAFSGDKLVDVADVKDLPARVLDRRRNMMHHFNYCPSCGKKINWKKIKELSSDC